MKNFLMVLFCFVTLSAAIYVFGRLYYHTTAGFTIGNITSDFSYQKNWETRPLTPVENDELQQALNQPYHYFAKGCQSYVFLSEDQMYVIKFFKYQHYRIQPWIHYFSFLPAVKKFSLEKQEKKWMKWNIFITSWKVAFDNLKNETGLVYVHLNKTTDLNKKLEIFDKLGKKIIVNLDNFEFCVQKKADMLEDTLLRFKKDHQTLQMQQLIDDLLTLITSEYARGLADNDHALMQNTGVSNGKPVHIDVGQFVFNEDVKRKNVADQELFTKTYRLMVWLKAEYPEAHDYLNRRLEEIIGSSYASMQPKFRLKEN